MNVLRKIRLFFFVGLAFHLSSCASLLAQQENNKEGAIENYRLSLQNSTGNKAQMAESYLQLAYLYFEGEKYVNAKSYFDSTMMIGLILIFLVYFV